MGRHPERKSERMLRIFDEVNARNEKKLLDETDLEVEYKLKKAWQRKHRRLGDLPHLKIGRMVRYDRASVESWLQKHLVGGGQ
jgi:predicted DNA-binding transcriptional regulator AlpA